MRVRAWAKAPEAAPHVRAPRLASVWARLERATAAASAPSTTSDQLSWPMRVRAWAKAPEAAPHVSSSTRNAHAHESAPSGGRTSAHAIQSSATPSPRSMRAHASRSTREALAWALTRCCGCDSAAERLVTSTSCECEERLVTSTTPSRCDIMLLGLASCATAVAYLFAMAVAFASGAASSVVAASSTADSAASASAAADAFLATCQAA